MRRTLSRLDRRLGATVRRAADAVPGAAATARGLAAATGPAFRLTVAAMIVNRPTRARGVRALAAAAAASLIARGLRDRLGRRRPGPRAEGGFPSRHAAAAAAIVVCAGGHDPRLGRALVVAAGSGLAARVAAAEHEPGDILAGAALGLVAAATMEHLARGRVG